MRHPDRRFRTALHAPRALVAMGAVLSWGCDAPPPAAVAPQRATMIAGPAPGSRLDVDGDGMVGSYTDALLILRYVSGFRGKALVDEAIGDRCTRCTAPEIELYISTL